MLRGMWGGGAAGVATLGAAGVEVAQSVCAETRTATLLLVPYLDTMRWVFIAVALVGSCIAAINRPWPAMIMPSSATSIGIVKPNRSIDAAI